MMRRGGGIVKSGAIKPLYCVTGGLVCRLIGLLPAGWGWGG